MKTAHKKCTTMRNYDLIRLYRNIQLMFCQSLKAGARTIAYGYSNLYFTCISNSNNNNKKMAKVYAVFAHPTEEANAHPTGRWLTEVFTNSSYTLED